MNETQLAAKIDTFVKDLDFLREVGSVISKNAQLSKSIEPLEKRISDLNGQLEVLQAKKDSLEASVNEEYKAKYEEIERRLNEAIVKEREANLLLSDNAHKVTEMEQARADMAKSKDYYDARTKEYEDKLAELRAAQEKASSLAQALNV